MGVQRRSIVTAAALVPFMGWCRIMAAETTQTNTAEPGRLVLSDFLGDEPVVIAGGGWRGFSDRVMGGISNARLGQDTVAGKNCIRLVGNVTRESNGGFIQMAMYFGRNDAELDAAAFRGIELLVYGNDEDYNCHVRTADCGWYEQSYRATFFARPEWQTVRLPWDAFVPNGLTAPLDASRINRIAILGWMREFEADISLAEIALYRAD
ncbi:MAG: CIA30 family protein [Gammaproteobacteria bacterium]|nr:CIA30 family protein [Gammaproteobacteria bacterium]